MSMAQGLFLKWVWTQGCSPCTPRKILKYLRPLRHSPKGCAPEARKQNSKQDNNEDNIRRWTYIYRFQRRVITWRWNLWLNQSPKIFLCSLFCTWSLIKYKYFVYWSTAGILTMLYSYLHVHSASQRHHN